MPIEFYCKSCETCLRTPESRAGLSARCPACGERVWVPHAEEVREPVSPWGGEGEESGWTAERQRHPGSPDPEDSPFESDDAEFLNEFQESDEALLEPEAPRQSPPRPAGLHDILNATWRIYSGNLGICLAATAVDLLLTLGALTVAMIPAALCVVFLFEAPQVCIPALMLALFVGGTLALSAVSIGHYRFFLALARGEPVRLGAMWDCSRCLGGMAVASVGFWMIVAGGFLMFVVPGLVALAFLWPYGRFVVDEDAGAGNSLSDAYHLTSGNFPTSLSIVLLNFLIIAAANFLPFFGHFFAIPLATVMHTVAYLHFRGEFVTGGRAELPNSGEVRKLA